METRPSVGVEERRRRSRAAGDAIGRRIREMRHPLHEVPDRSGADEEQDQLGEVVLQQPSDESSRAVDG